MQPFRDEVSARLAELAPRLFDQLDGMTERMAEVLQRNEPAYRRMAERDAGELHRSARAGLERGIRSLIGAAAGDTPTMQRKAREVGRRRAAQGVPLESVLRAYRLGGQLTWEALLAVSPPGDVLLLEVAGSVWRTNDIECAAVAEGYREEQLRLAEADEAARQRVLDGLLDGRGGDPAFERAASELLGVPLEGRLLTVVALPDPAGEPTLADPGPALLRRGIRSVWGTRSGAQVGVLVLGSRRPDQVVGWLSSLAGGPVGVSDVVEGAAATAAAYRMAETAARTLASGEARVVSIDERLPEALLTNSPEISSRLVARSLGGLLALPEEERAVLLDTLAAFLAADGSPTRAAEALYCHRNTVMHRLRRIEAVTGRTTTDQRSRLLWQLALLSAGREAAGSTA